MKVMQELEQLTFVVQHNPNCPRPFLVRLVGLASVIDYKPPEKTADILGYGKTLREAAAVALKIKEKKRVRRLNSYGAQRRLERKLPGIGSRTSFPRD